MDYSFGSFKKNAIIRFLGLETYNYLKENLYKCDISKDKEYQTKFNAFYRVRRDEKWREIFYTYFEDIKNNKTITFDELVSYMYEKTGNIEASFCSKLLSTINPNMPIWDQYVLANLGLKVEGNTKEEKLKNTVIIYNKILETENSKLKLPEIQQSIKDFKEYFAEYKLSDIKILDYLLWNSR